MRILADEIINIWFYESTRKDIVVIILSFRRINVRSWIIMFLETVQLPLPYYPSPDHISQSSLKEFDNCTKQ